MTSAYQDIMEGLDQAARHAAGEVVPGVVVHVPENLDVAAIRGKTKLSQPAFANSIGVQTSTLRQWEQGRRRPEGPARVLLAVVDSRPTIVMETLGRVPPAATDPKAPRGNRRAKASAAAEVGRTSTLPPQRRRDDRHQEK